jgi:hypothetical protein
VKPIREGTKMSKKLLTVLSILAFFSLSPLMFAGEMERFSLNPNPELFGPIMGTMRHQMEINNFDNSIQDTDLLFPRTNHIANFKVIDPLPKSHLNNQISKSYMEPISRITKRWHARSHDYVQKQFDKSFVNFVPDPSAVYMEKKLKNDLCKTANTMVSVGSAAVGGPLAKVGSVANVIHNFGPQTGRMQNVSGNVGDVVSGVSALKTASQAVRRDFSNLDSGVVGISNTVFGKITDAHKRTLRQPVTTSATKNYRLRSNDGFTSMQRVGTITVTKTYTPPKRIRAFGPPGIFEGTSTTLIKKHGVVTTHTGNFNHAFKGNTYRIPNVNKYQRPCFTSSQTFKAPKSYIPSLKSPTLNNRIFRTPTFKRPSFRMPTFQVPRFGRIR